MTNDKWVIKGEAVGTEFVLLPEYQTGMYQVSTLANSRFLYLGPWMGFRGPMNLLKWYVTCFIMGGEGKLVSMPFLWGRNHCSQETFKMVLSLTVLRTTMLIVMGYEIGFS